MDQIGSSKIVIDQPKEKCDENFFKISKKPLKKENGEAGECGPCLETIRCCNLCASCFNNWCLCCRNVKNLCS